MNGSQVVVTTLTMIAVAVIILNAYWNSGNEQLQFLAFVLVLGAAIASPFIILKLILMHLEYKKYLNVKKLFKPLTVKEIVPVGTGSFMGGSIYHVAKLSDGQVISMVSLSLKEGDKVYSIDGKLWRA